MTYTHARRGKSAGTPSSAYDTDGRQGRYEPPPPSRHRHTRERVRGQIDVQSTPLATSRPPGTHTEAGGELSTTRRNVSGSGAGRGDVHQIGEVAEQVGLSLRTVRYYEEAGLLTPVDRTVGGFRLYDRDAIERLLLIRKMKPLGFSLEEMRALLLLRDELGAPGLSPEVRGRLRERLATWVTLAEQKLASLRDQVDVAEAFVDGLHLDADRTGTF